MFRLTILATSSQNQGQSNLDVQILEKLRWKKFFMQNSRWLHIESYMQFDVNPLHDRWIADVSLKNF